MKVAQKRHRFRMESWALKFSKAVCYFNIYLEVTMFSGNLILVILVNSILIIVPTKMDAKFSYIQRRNFTFRQHLSKVCVATCVAVSSFRTTGFEELFSKMVRHHRILQKISINSGRRHNSRLQNH